MEASLRNKKGKFGIIITVTTSYSNHGLKLIKNFFSKVIIEKIIISEAETAFSIDSKFQEMIIIGYKNDLEKIDDINSNIVNIITLKEVVTVENVSNII